MSAGQSTMTVDYSNDPATKAATAGLTPQQNTDYLNTKVFGNTTNPPAPVGLDVTDTSLMNARKAAALRLTQGQDRSNSFLTGPMGSATPTVNRKGLLGL